MFSYPPFGEKEEGQKSPSLWADYLNPLILVFSALVLRCFTPGKPDLSSIALSLLVVLATYYLGRLLFSSRTAFLGSLLLSFSAYHIFRSQESLNYPLLSFLWVSASYFFLRYLRNGKTIYWLGWSISTLLSLYDSYFSICLIAVQLVIWLGQENRSARSKGLVLAYLAVFIGFLPQLIILLSCPGAPVQGGSPLANLKDLLSETAKITFGPYNEVLLFILGLLAVLPLIIYSAFTLKAQTRYFLLGFLLIPVVWGFLFSRLRIFGIGDLSFLYFIMPALCLVYGWAMARIPQKLICGIFLGMFLSLNLVSWYKIEFTRPHCMPAPEVSGEIFSSKTEDNFTEKYYFNCDFQKGLK